MKKPYPSVFELLNNLTLNYMLYDYAALFSLQIEQVFRILHIKIVDIQQVSIVSNILC